MIKKLKIEMTKMKYFILISSFFIATNTFAQVGINNPNPDTSAVLDIKSNTKGLLLPRTTDLERRSMAFPANSLIVFDTTDQMMFFYDTQTSGENWTAVNPWNLRDDLSAFDGTLYKRDITSNKTVRSVTIGSETINPDNELNVANNATIGSVTVDAPQNGLYVEGETRVNNSLVVTNTVTANDLMVTNTVTANDFVGYGITPVGGIIMWSGSTVAAAIPDGWLLCNGQGIVGGSMSGQNTPNLSGRFIVSVGDNGLNNYTAPNQIGGADAVALTSEQMPAHVHTGTTNNDGAHSHAGNGSSNYKDGETTGTNRSLFNTGGGTSTISSTGSAHQHAFTTESTGGNVLGTTIAHENRPAYYVLAYIMRVL